jgi:hypothetical protein
MNKQFKRILIVAVILFLGYVFFLDFNAEKHFYCSSFNGKITGIKYSIENYPYVELSNSEWFYLGRYIDDFRKISVKVGDSIVKYPA